MLDNSWYPSNWHGKTYGLEADPWTAVEAVPYLCAVSLKSSCEEFCKPKRVMSGTHTNTSQSGSPRDFVHVNNIPILASDDDESPGECCASKHTTKIPCQPWKCGGERGDECRCGDERVDEFTTPDTKVSSHRGSDTLNLNAHQVSYLATSGGDSKGVHHVSGPGWRRVSAIMDSESAECVALESIARSIPLVETEASRQGQTYHTADVGVTKNKGEKTVTMYSENGEQYRARYQITDVTRPLNSVSRVCDPGNIVLFTQTGGRIINHETFRYTWFPREHGVCVLHSWMNEFPTKKRVRWPDDSFPRQEY